MSSITALIVDDCPANIVLLKHYLALQQIECISATTGIDGFALAQQLQPDIILTDLLMPVPTWDGYETIRHLKAHPRTAYIPVIAVTAAGNEEESYSAGCDGYLHRPFDINQLRDVLNTHLNLTS